MPNDEAGISRFFFLGVRDQLVAIQIACLSSLGLVILSDILSLGLDLSSLVVRTVLRSWIALGDVLAVRMTLPFVLLEAMSDVSTAVRLLCWTFRRAQQFGLSVSCAVRQQGRDH